LKEEVAALPKRVAVIEAKLAATKAKLEKAKTAAKADEATRKKHESAIQDAQGKISKYKDQSLAVKTNDQYKALMQEIQFAEQEIRSNEDRILDLMVNAETREKDVRAAEAELKAETAEIEKEKEQARQRTAEDEKLLAEWNGKRNTMRGGVNPDILRHYERVMKFRGSGISEVRDQKCMACQVMLRPQTYNEVRAGQKVIPEFVKKFQIDFPIWKGATADDLGRLGMGEAVPATAFLDEQGMIFSRVQGEIKKEELTERLLWITGDRKGPTPNPLVRNL